MTVKPPVPPFSLETAIEKVQLAENGWNSRQPEKVAQAYTLDSKWRNRSQFIQGRAAITAFLTQKWQKEQEYRLVKELWAFSDDRIAVRFAYEYKDAANIWHRAYGNENWQFDDNGLMHTRIASINEHPITENQRKLHWPQGLRPQTTPSLTELGL